MSNRTSIHVGPETKYILDTLTPQGWSLEQGIVFLIYTYAKLVVLDDRRLRKGFKQTPIFSKLKVKKPKEAKKK